MSDADAYAYKVRWERFMGWNGDGKPPTFSHRSGGHVITIEAVSRNVSRVLCDGKVIGNDDAWPQIPCRNLATGNYDRELGDILQAMNLPTELADWNNLG